MNDIEEWGEPVIMFRDKACENHNETQPITNCEKPHLKSLGEMIRDWREDE